MPKKTIAARSGAQRQKPRAQKSFELVRPEGEERDDEVQVGTVPVAPSAVAETFAPTPQASKQPARTAKNASVATVIPERVVEPKSVNASAEAPKVSASTRMAARRQATQRTQQRSSATLITAEHFAYVRRDLIIIATLAILMFTAIIVLYFAFGRGA